MVELLIPKLIFTILIQVIMSEFDKVQHFPKIWKQSKDYLLDNSSDTYLNFHLWGHWIS